MKGVVWGLLLLLITGTVAAAGVYKWVDEKGRVHYGERPPGSARAQEMQIKEAPQRDEPADEAAREDQQQRLLRAFEEERAQKEEAQQKSKAEAAQRERKCAQARDRLARYKRSGYLYDLDEKGERRVLSDAEREATMREAEAAVTQWCQ